MPTPNEQNIEKIVLELQTQTRVVTAIAGQLERIANALEKIANKPVKL